MIGKNENMKIWKQVEVTNPEWLKDANIGGNKIKTINPQKQLKQATELFGPYGSTWGLKEFTLELITLEQSVLFWLLKGTFYYPSGEFPVSNTIKFAYISSKGKYITDDEATKKIETNTVSKSLSRLGFGSDVFEGRFETQGYSKLASYSMDASLSAAKIKAAKKAIKTAPSIVELTRLWNSNQDWQINTEVCETYRDSLQKQ